MAAVLYLSAFTQGHEPVAGSSFAVACGAEAGDVVHLHEPADYFIQGTVVYDVELFGFLAFGFWLAVAAYACAGAAADLGDPEMQDTLTYFLAFSCGNDHAGIRNGDSDAGNDLGEGIIVNSIGK